MPLHDWTSVDSGTYHDFHRDWTVELCRRLNAGILPTDYHAILHRRAKEPDGLAAPVHVGPMPAARIVQRAEGFAYAMRADQIVIRREDETVALIEITTPGLIRSRLLRRELVAEVCTLFGHGVHLLLMDPFPTTASFPAGLHATIWEDYSGRSFDPLPADKPLAASSFDAGDDLTAYVEPLAVGDPLPDMPLFLKTGVYVPCPLEAAYATSWAALPAEIREVVKAVPG